MHSALREVHDTLDRMLALADQIRGSQQITDIVNIGIGGSHLGPEVVVNALEDWIDQDKNFHFVSNVDGHELGHVLRRVKPESTLFLIASKSFTTAETMLNARSARQWFLDHGGSEDPQAPCSIDQHFVALTTNTQAAAEFGIQRTLGFWDWVGGRFSLWSAIGLPIAIAIGSEQFRALLDGAHAMDAHFFTAHGEQSPGAPGTAGRLVSQFLPVFQPLHCPIQPWPAPPDGLSAATGDGEQWQKHQQEWRSAHSSHGTGDLGRARHQWAACFFQMLHQGQDVIPVEFIALRDGGKYLGEHHQSLVVNAIAQAQALMVGRCGEGLEKDCPGNRPSSFLMLERLDPASLGALIALYEHRIFVSGAIWDINSFDQWGVELGKKLAKQLHARQNHNDWAGVDASTQELMKRLMEVTEHHKQRAGLMLQACSDRAGLRQMGIAHAGQTFQSKLGEQLTQALRRTALFLPV
jgi:glucose-6-phosphate isomerase